MYARDKSFVFSQLGFPLQTAQKHEPTSCCQLGSRSHAAPYNEGVAGREGEPKEPVPTNILWR